MERAEHSRCPPWTTTHRVPPVPTSPAPQATLPVEGQVPALQSGATGLGAQTGHSTRKGRVWRPRQPHSHWDTWESSLEAHGHTTQQSGSPPTKASVPKPSLLHAWDIYNPHLVHSSIGGLDPSGPVGPAIRVPGNSPGEWEAGIWQHLGAHQAGGRLP